jgi:coproporphyrinogen III oxidase-like Fe-S oxidoreductase
VTRGGGKIASRQLRAPEAWLAAVETAGTAIEDAAPVARDDAVNEMLMMGLRLVEGVARRRLEMLAERAVEDLFGDALARLVDGGFLTLDADWLAATAAGRQRLNAVLAALLA